MISVHDLEEALIPAIEAEARRAVLTTLRGWVEDRSLELVLGKHTEPYRHGREDAFLSVLAEIDRLMAEADKPEEGAS